jgi:ribosome-binding protein aMBF1 (putative translation factor)
MLIGVDLKWRSVQMTLKGSFDERIRRAIRADGRSLYRLAKDAGIDVAPLQRFMKAEQTFRLPTAEKLCRVVGLDLHTVKRQKRR